MSNLIEGDLNQYFSAENNWKIIPISAAKIDLRDTKRGEKIRCIDYRFGIKPDGTYDPDLVSRAPAWLGAMDGIQAFLDGNAEERAQLAAEMVKEEGFIPADHGDYLRGDIEGCAFRRALLQDQFPDLNKIAPEEIRVLRSKVGVEHVSLHKTDKHPSGFLLNPNPFTTALPNDGEYYPIDVWFPAELGIEPERFFPVIEKCGELLLPEDNRILFVVSH